MRGKVGTLHCKSSVNGITPAYAGKSARWSGLRGLDRDHPRVCGEKVALLRIKPLTLGSPPRMRGKVYKQLKEVSQYGITPAYAGKSTPVSMFHDKH